MDKEDFSVSRKRREKRKFPKPGRCGVWGRGSKEGNISDGHQERLGILHFTLILVLLIKEKRVREENKSDNIGDARPEGIRATGAEGGSCCAHLVTRQKLGHPHHWRSFFLGFHLQRKLHQPESRSPALRPEGAQPPPRTLKIKMAGCCCKWLSMQNGAWKCRFKLLHKVKFLILLIWIRYWKEFVHFRCQYLIHYLTHRKASAPSVLAFLSS